MQPASFKDRELLQVSDHCSAVAWMGARLAEALDYAHRQGVLHRDIKPDNILISQFGRPYLADFNLAIGSHHFSQNEGLFGGSLSYMSPEHLDAFNPLHPARAELVNEQSDIYSLGVVIHEFLTLQLPFPTPRDARPTGEALLEMAEQRRRPPRLDALSPLDQDRSFALVLNRCLQPAPADRYRTAAEIARDLDAAMRLHELHKRLPRAGSLGRIAARRPLTALMMAALLPQLLGSAVNISYNSLRIVNRLNESQAEAFFRIVAAYNLIAYPIGVAILFWAVRPLLAYWRPSRQTDPSPPRPADLAEVRRCVTRFPTWLAVISCLGWLPGGIIFPLALEWSAGPIPRGLFSHFLVDFTISGLIATTYSLFAVGAITLPIIYPRLLVGEPDPQQSARRELGGVRLRLWIVQTLAGIIPLAGAVLLVQVGPSSDHGYDGFRLLVSALIGLGMVGFCVAVWLINSLQQTLTVLCGQADEASK
jgi:hypothetical protein